MHPYTLSQLAGEWRRDVLAQARQQRLARQLAALASASRRAGRAERRMRQATRRARQLRARLEQ
jgi:uncharacterized protein involved in exopolysaccharide biosynthesis